MFIYFFECQALMFLNNNKYNYVNFEIERVFAGWFDVSFSFGKDNVVISASDVYGNDGPRMLLEKFSEFYYDKCPQKVIVWDEEPGNYFIIFNRVENNCSLSISYSQEAEDKLTQKVRDIIDEVPKSELVDLLDDWEDLLVVENIGMEHLLKVMFERFSEFDTKEYENNWMDYPNEQLDNIKNMMNSK